MFFGKCYTSFIRFYYFCMEKERIVMLKYFTNTKIYLHCAAVLVVVTIAISCYYLMASFSQQQTTTYLYIDDNDTQDSVYNKLTDIASTPGMAALRTLCRHSGYAEQVRTGRYAIEPGVSTFRIWRKLKNGAQDPLNLTIPESRTMERLAALLGNKLMIDSMEIVNFLKDSSQCAMLGYDTATIPALFVPNTYSIYWNIGMEAFMQRMKKEHDVFWSKEGRKEKAQGLNLTEDEVATLASIIDEETANNGEKPMVAGMYLNRLNYKNTEYPEGMPLQADPTVKFALGDFSIRRIYHKHLLTDSRYNTYKYPGLPPGPIKIASIRGIDAVLNHAKHDYLYMCAKEDFSGTHNFAKTYDEHLRNAARYAKSLNERGIN